MEAEEVSIEIDQTTIATLVRLGKASGFDLLGEASKLFLIEGPRRIGGIKTALAESNREQLRHWTHSLGGGAGALGGLSLAHRCRELEARAKEEDLRQLTTLVEQIDEAYQRMVAELRSLIARKDPASD